MRHFAARVRDSLMKTAGSSLVHETLGTNLYAMMPGFAMLTAGSTLAGTGRARSPAAFRRANEQQSDLENYVPGVAAYRIGQRMADVARESGGNIRRAKKKARAEVLGTYTSILAPALLAAGLRAAGTVPANVVNTRLPFGRNLPGVDVSSALLGDLRRGAAVGLAGTAVGLAAAAIRRRRSPEEQAAVDKESTLYDYLIPGWSAFDHYKRLGRTLDWKRDPAAFALQSPVSPIGEVPASDPVAKKDGKW